MSKRPFRRALVIVAATVVLLLAVGGYLLYAASQYPDEPNPGAGKTVEVEIKTGMSFPQIASLLAAKGVVEKPTWFRLYAMWRGDTTSVKSGTYQLADNLTPRVVLDAIVEGVREETAEVTLPPGLNMLEMFAILECPRPRGAPESTPCPPSIAKAADLEVVARDPEFLAAHAIPGETVEGYLYPDTYQFRVPEKPERVLERLIGEFQKRWNQAIQANPRGRARARDRLGWGDREILILASIVEKEAVDPAEQPRIAQVFINRLTSPAFTPKRLETDPTIRYGCLVPVRKSAACAEWLTTCAPGLPPKCPRLRSAQLDDRENPYNTYEHDGLPPGPITNPGEGAIRAVLKPDGSDYFYFVAKTEREHVFSRTYAEHKRAVDKYQR
jgi:UPF0755 protein